MREPTNNLQDLVNMALNFEKPDIKSLFESAYSRGFQDGYEKVKETIIQEIKKL